MNLWALSTIGAGFDTLELLLDEVPIQGVIG